MSKRKAMTGGALGEKLLQSVREMKAGKTARAAQVAPSETDSFSENKPVGSPRDGPKPACP